MHQETATPRRAGAPPAADVASAGGLGALDADDLVERALDMVAVAERCGTPLGGAGTAGAALATLLFDSLISSVPANLYFKDRDGRYLCASSRYVRTRGFSSQAELIGRTALETGVARPQAARIRSSEVCLLSGDITVYDEEELLTFGERTAWYRVTKQVIRDAGGERVGTMAILLNITDLKRSQEELIETLERLAATQDELLGARKLEAIGQLAAGIAHEINTPIQFIADNTRFVGESIEPVLDVIGRAGALAAAVESGAGPDELVRLAGEYRSSVDDADLAFLAEELPPALEQTVAGTQRVADIVRGLKDFAHPGTGPEAPVDLNRAIDATIAVSTGERKHVAEVDFTPDPTLPTVVGDSSGIHQALLIVVVNAAQALGDQLARGERDGLGRISIETRLEEPHVVIDVADDGPGMPAEVAARVFDPFFTTKDIGSGTGQGLAIAHGAIVQRGGGELTVRSEPGVGTTFTIRLRTDRAPVDATA